MEAPASPAAPAASPRRSWWVVLPPPPLFVLAFFAGLGVARAAPLAIAPASFAPLVHGVGIVVIALGVLLLAPAPLLFLRRRTTIVPHRTARALVVSGPYRLTRNPMYLGLTLLYVGATLMANLAGPLVLVAAPLWVLQVKTIPFEERVLTQVFGDEYRAYCGRVRRWI